MYQVVHQEQNAMELGVDGALTREEFGQMVHQMESLATTHGPINVMLDLTNLDDYDKAIAVDELKFYRENKESLRKVAVVTDDPLEKFFTMLFDKFTNTDVRRFSGSELEAARDWTFDSPLP